MARFLSPEWLAELDAALRADAEIVALTGDARIVVEQRVTRSPVPVGPSAGGDATNDGADSLGGDAVVYHVALDHGRVSVDAGPAVEPTVTFTQDEATARSIATGEESAQRAFMSGTLRVGGDLQLLATHQAVLARLGDVFASVRATTDFGPAPEA